MKSYTEIEGWFSHSRTYLQLLDTMPDFGTFVEVGAWLGRSTAYLCANAGVNHRICVVDTWLGTPNEWKTTHKLATQIDLFTAFSANLQGYNYEPFRMTSELAATYFPDASVDVVFLDADHTYEATKADIKRWLPKVKAGGYLAGHDYCKEWEGVIQAVDEIFGEKKEVNVADTCWLYHVQS